MILELALEHRVIPGKTHKAQIWGVDATEVAGIRQSKGDTGLRGLVHELVRTKLPHHLYNYEVVDWEFRDSYRPVGAT